MLAESNIRLNDKFFEKKSNNHKFFFYDGTYSLDIYDPYEYMNDLKKEFTKEQFTYLQKVIAYYVTSEQFKELLNTEKDKTNIKKIQA